MSVIVHASDLHIGSERTEQTEIFDALIEGLRLDHRARGRDIGLLTLTGDIFDSGALPRERAIRQALELVERMRDALGGDVPTVIVPGNHDRRRAGLVGPHREELFAALGRAAPGGVFVHGIETPFLAQVVPHALHGLPMWLVAYDSSFLPRGLLGAGGWIRREDLLHAASVIGDAEPDWPIVLLQHHHLVPTPATDLEPIEPPARSGLLRFGVSEVLPRLLANADREEWMMTALGAGTALSTLHSLGRAVLVLHGHKHNATARVLAGTRAGDGDVLIASAGSAGVATPWRASRDHDGPGARLWPSFNVVELAERALTVETTSFGWKGRSRGELAYRPLVWAERAGRRWMPEPVKPAFGRAPGPRLAENEGTYQLLRSKAHGEGRWDLECVRRVIPAERSRIPHYYEEVRARNDAAIVTFDARHGDGEAHASPLHLELAPDARTRFLIPGGVFRTLDERARAEGEAGSPFEHISLYNRYESAYAKLELRGLGASAIDAFASLLDLATGLERPLPLQLDQDHRVVVEAHDCPARTALRIHWPLARPEAAPRRRPDRAARSSHPPHPPTEATS